jgi:iron complex transport system substrate-binding protein
MQNKIIFAMVAVAIIIIAAIGGAMMLGDTDDADEPIIGEDVDFAGREIQTVEDLNDGIVAIGQDSFRWMTYFGLADKCIMIDINDKTNFMGKSFISKAAPIDDVNEYDANDFSHTNCGITSMMWEHIDGRTVAGRGPVSSRPTSQTNTVAPCRRFNVVDITTI